uniref:hypothetical protein n=1 Tax=Acinetobacter baumannii TaxID=470 RepID=UPI001C06C89E
NLQSVSGNFNLNLLRLINSFCEFVLHLMLAVAMMFGTSHISETYKSFHISEITFVKSFTIGTLVVGYADREIG